MHSTRTEGVPDAASPARILDLLDEVYYYLEAGGELLQWNERLSEVTGYSHDAIAEMSATDFFVSEYRTRIREAISTVVSGGREVTVEAYFLTSDGDRIPYEFVAKPVVEDGETRGLIGIGRDVTDRQERKHELRRLENAVEHAGHAVVITDADGVIEYVNPAFERIAGHTREQAVGETPRILKSGDHSKAFYEDLWGTILDGEVWDGEVVNRRRSGERYTVNQTIAPIRDPDGAIEGFVSIRDDITGRKLREQQLEVFDRILRHNLRNKGSVVIGSADTLAESTGERTHHERLETIRESMQSLIDLSKKARDAGDLLTGVLDGGATCELLPALERIRADVASSYPGADISIAGEPAPTRRVNARVTPAFHELIENAVKHADGATARVDVTVTTDVTTATVRIADDGAGIPPQDRRAIENGTEEPLSHSSGIGLWLTNWLVAYAGGDVRIDVSDRGTTVEVTVPYSEADPPGASSATDRDCRRR